MKSKLLFQVLFFVAAMFVFQSCADEIEVQPDLEMVDANDASYRYAVGPGTPHDELGTCFNGGISVDYDCDGSYELGWNHTASSAAECQQMVQAKISEAIFKGWCYTTALHPNNCQPSLCWM